MGWKEGSGDTATAAVPDSSISKAQGSDDIWDDDPSSTGRGGGGSGLGVSVSTMAPEANTEREHGSLHSLSIVGDADGVKTYLQEHPEANINETDEYVSTLLDVLICV